MDSTSLSDQDLANFRSIFDQNTSDENQTSSKKEVTSNTNLRLKYILGAILVAVIALCVFVIWPLRSYRLFMNESSTVKGKEKQNKKFIFEPTMIPDRVNKIRVFGIRTTQPPPSRIVDSSCFFDN